MPHIDLIESGEHSINVLCVLETLSNALSHAVHLDASLRTVAADGILAVARC